MSEMAALSEMGLSILHFARENANRFVPWFPAASLGGLADPTESQSVSELKVSHVSRARNKSLLAQLQHFPLDWRVVRRSQRVCELKVLHVTRARGNDYLVRLQPLSVD